MNPQKLIIDALNASDKPLPLRDVAAAIGLCRNTVSTHMSILQQRGKVEGFGENNRRVWSIPGRVRNLNNPAPEFIKVSSIWRVAQRYAAQVQA